MFNNKTNLFRFSHSKSNEFNDVNGHRASSHRAEGSPKKMTGIRIYDLISLPQQNKSKLICLHLQYATNTFNKRYQTLIKPE